MSRRKLTIYLTIIGLGLVAWTMDAMRGSSRSPSRAIASGVLPDTNATTRALPPTNTVPTLTVTCAAFPKFQGEPIAEADGRDPFVIPQAIRMQISSLADAEAGDKNSKPASSPPSVRFMKEHQLSAVLLVNGSRVAVVDGLIVAEGQIVDECELQHVTRRFAQFACPDAEARLIIESTLPVAENTSTK